MSRRILLALGVALGAFQWSPAVFAECRRPWMFFDLGNTIVDTATHNFEKISYMPGAYEYLEELSQSQYPIGLIVNVPESWGNGDLEKIMRIKLEIGSVWSDSRPMNWGYFQNAFLVPPKDALAKPNPYLFVVAYRMADAAGCRAIYQGENPTEIQAALAAGMEAYQTGVPGRPAFLPIGEINAAKREIVLTF